MIIVGLTGGIGSGKSTVANLFAKLGTAIIDTDVIAKELLELDKPAYLDVVKCFGDCILLPNREIDRFSLKQRIISNNEDRSNLENILHPLIQQIVKKRIKLATGSYCIIVIPLLIEKNNYPMLNRILVIDATVNKQIERVRQRDGLTQSDIKKFITLQASRQQRLDAADDVISNDQGLAELTAATQLMHAKYLKL